MLYGVAHANSSHLFLHNCTNPSTRRGRNLKSCGFLVTGQVEDTVAAHTGGDIPLSAQGRGAKFFTGTMDNTDVFFKAMQAAIGGASN